MSQLKNPSARKELRGNIWPVEGSIARTAFRDPDNPADALYGFPVLACRIVEYCSPFHNSVVAPSVTRLRTSFGDGPQSCSQFRFVRSEGLLPKSLLMLSA